eukprot:TRINITY_DN27009_c0_g1_i1.p1 TRINITY_DN27009_c0_g1~~TRINITY_DN27009_c0_g1_i1.p1  ORF type:complete len:925 (+),score=137.94 TRINITY_DN27009_c0_g1_i1:46-2775(+)
MARFIDLDLDLSAVAAGHRVSEEDLKGLVVEPLRARPEALRCALRTSWPPESLQSVAAAASLCFDLAEGPAAAELLAALLQRRLQAQATLSEGPLSGLCIPGKHPLLVHAQAALRVLTQKPWAPCGDARPLLGELLRCGRVADVRGLHHLVEAMTSGPGPTKLLWCKLFDLCETDQVGTYLELIRHCSRLLASQSSVVQGFGRELCNELGEQLMDPDADEFDLGAWTERLARVVLWDMLWGESSEPSEVESTRGPEALSRSVSACSSAGEKFSRLQTLFPAEVTAGALGELTVLGRRLDGAGTSDAELRSHVQHILSHFLTAAPLSLDERRLALQQAVASDKRNVERRAVLQQCGYSPRLWAEGDLFRVTVGEGQQSLSGCLVTGLLSSAVACGDGMAGCYAPDAGRRIKPLEVGLRDDCLFFSIEDSDGREVENCEVLLCDEAAYMYQAYGRSHSHDTSAVWLALMVHVLRSGLIPALAIRNGHPTASSHKRLRRTVPVEEWGGELSHVSDFWEGSASYFDHPPAIRAGEDVLLTRDVVRGVALPTVSLQGPAACGTATSCATRVELPRGFGAELFASAMKAIGQDPSLAQLSGALGRSIHLWHQDLLSTGQSNLELLFKGFDLERFNRHKPESEKLDDAKLSAVHHRLQRVLEQNLTEQLQLQDLGDLCASGNLSEVHQIRNFLKKAGKKYKCALGEKKLRNSLRFLPIKSLPSPRGTMLWIHRQEDRVWRSRGGRPGHESAASFLAFLDGPLPGMVVLCGDGPDAPVVAYAVGEMSGLQYEIVCAWVHEAFRGLGLALSLYTALAKMDMAAELICDVVLGTSDRLAKALPRYIAPPVLWFCIKDRRPSFRIENDFGQSEQFERLVVRARILSLAETLARQRPLLEVLCHPWVITSCIVLGIAVALT